MDILDFDGYYWIAGNNSLHRIRKSDNVNYANFLEWENFFEDNDLFLTDIRKIEEFNGKIYFGTENGLFEYDGSEITLVLSENGYTFNQVRKVSGNLLVGAICDNFCPNKLFILDGGGSFTELGMNCVRSLNNFIIDENGRFWVADLFDNLTYSNSVSGGCQRIGQN